MSTTLLHLHLQPDRPLSTRHSHGESATTAAPSARSKTSSSCSTQSPIPSRPSGSICRMWCDSKSPTLIETIPRYSICTASRRRRPGAGTAVRRRSVMPCWRQATTTSFWSTGVRSRQCPGMQMPYRMGREWADTSRDLCSSC